MINNNLKNNHEGSHASHHAKKWNWRSKKGLVFLVSIVLGAVTGVFLFQEYWISAQNKDLIARIEKKQESIQKITYGLKSENFITLSDVYKKAEALRVKWSEVVGKISQFENEDVQFLSFSSTADKEINITGEAKNLETLTNFIRILNQEKNIQNPFVSSLSQKEDGSYQFQLSFTLSSSSSFPNSQS